MDCGGNDAAFVAKGLDDRNHSPCGRGKKHFLILLTLGMKTFVLFASGLFAISSIQAQTTNTIIFANNNSSLISNAFTGALVVSNDFVRAQLYWAPEEVGTNEQSYVAVGGAVNVINGRYTGGTRVIPSPLPLPGVWIQVRAFEYTRGNSYEEAIASPPAGWRGALVGKSRPYYVPLGGGPLVPAPQSSIVGPFSVDAFGGGAFLRVNDIAVAEGSNGLVTAKFTVSLSTTQEHAVSVDFATQDGTAIAGQDYVATNGTLNFEVGETSKAVRVQVTADEPVESEESFSLVLSNPVDATIIKPQGFCTITEVRITAISVDTLVSFNTIASRRYMVEKTTDLQTWTPVAGATNVLGTGSIVTALDRGSGCASAVLYRARLLGQEE